MKIALSRIMSLYPEGISRNNYDRICRLINKHGVGRKIEIPADAEDHEGLTAALKDVERTGKVFSDWTW